MRDESSRLSRITTRLLVVPSDGFGGSMMKDRIEEGLLGTFLGVFVPTLSTLFGVVIFLRLGEAVGAAGLGVTFALLASGFTISLLTSLSLCALVTNGPTISSGGLYAALRKSIGIDYASILGMTFYLAYCVGISFYVYGFALSTTHVLSLQSDRQIMQWNSPGSWVDVLVSSVVLLCLVLITLLGLRRSVFVAFSILVVIVLCIVVSLMCLVCATDSTVVGYTAFSWSTLESNWKPDSSSSSSSSFDHQFMILFPGFTGVIAGANLSGDLRTPDKSIVRGTLSALLVAFVTYQIISFILASTVKRDRLEDNSMIIEEVVKGVLGIPILYVGIGATTLSSALSYLLGAPRIISAIARDDQSAHPVLRWFSVRSNDVFSIFKMLPGDGDDDEEEEEEKQQQQQQQQENKEEEEEEEEKTKETRTPPRRKEPLRALFLTWLICQSLLLTGALDKLSRLMTCTFLVIFFLINLTCLAMEIMLPDTIWRPSFRLYSKWTAISGTVTSFSAVVYAREFYYTAFVLVALLLGVIWKRHAIQALFRRDYFVMETGRPTSHRLRDDNKEDHSSSSLLERNSSIRTLRGHSVRVRTSEEDLAATKSALVRAAAEYVRDGFDSRFYRGRRKEDNEEEVDADSTYYGQREVVAKRLFHRIKQWRQVVLVVFICIAFFERPPWKTTSSSSSRDYVRFGMPELKPYQTAIIELVCLSSFGLEIFLKARFMGTKSLTSSGWHVLQVCLICLDFGSLLLVLISDEFHIGLGLIVRPLLFVAKSRSVRVCVCVLPRNHSFFPTLTNCLGPRRFHNFDSNSTCICRCFCDSRFCDSLWCRCGMCSVSGQHGGYRLILRFR